MTMTDEEFNRRRVERDMIVETMRCPNTNALWLCDGAVVEIVREVRKLAMETGIDMGAIYKLMVEHAEIDATVAENAALLRDQRKAEEDYLHLQRRPKDIQWLFHVLWRTRDAWQRLADRETDPEKRKLISAELAEHDAIEEQLFAKVEFAEARANGEAH